MIAENEIWKKIEGYEKYYEVSNMGRVKSFHKNKETLLKGTKSGNYLRVSLQLHGKASAKFIHRLVADAFLTKGEYTIINHIDGNPLNNIVSNLEWCNGKENSQHAVEKKLFIPNKYKIGQYSMDGNLIQEFDSIKEAMEITKISYNKIISCCRGNLASYKNFIWKYINFVFEICEQPVGKKYDGFSNYIITQDGKVFSISHKKFMSTRLNNGYEYVSLGNGKDKKEKKDFSIHFLVGKLYIPNPNNYPMINHKDMDKTNNRVENLEWCSYSDNMKHYYETSKNNKCVSINKLDINSNFLETYKSIRDAARKNNISASSISQVLKGDKRITAAGFKWEYNKNKEIASSV